MGWTELIQLLDSDLDTGFYVAKKKNQSILTATLLLIVIILVLMPTGANHASKGWMREAICDNQNECILLMSPKQSKLPNVQLNSTYRKT